MSTVNRGGRRRLAGVGLGALVMVVVWVAVLDRLEGGTPEAGTLDPARLETTATLRPQRGPGEPPRAPAALAAEGPPDRLAPEATAVGPDRGVPASQRLRVTGRVVDASGRTVAGADVILHPSRRQRRRLGLAISYQVDDVPWAAFATTRSDGQGRFLLEGSEWADAGGWRPTDAGALADRTSVVVASGGFQVQLVPVPGTAWEVDLGDVVLQPAAIVTGRLVDAAGRPVVGATFGGPRQPHAGSWHSGWEVIRALLGTTSGADGRFRADRHWPGSYRLEATSPGLQRWTGGVDLRVGRPLDLGEIVLRTAARLEGRVVDGAGAPLAGARIKLRPHGVVLPPGEDTILRDMRMSLSAGFPAREFEATTDAAGRFAFDELVPTEYTVYAHAAGYEPARESRVAAGSPPLELALQPEALLALTLVDDETGAPVADAEVHVQRLSSAGRQPRFVVEPYLDVLTGAAAAQRLGRPGAGIGCAVAGPIGSARTRVLATAPGYAPQTVDLPGQAPGALLEHTLRMDRGAHAAGLVTDATGRPLSGASVTVEGASAGSSQSVAAESDADGSFRLEGLPDGTWSVSVSKPGFYQPSTRELHVEQGAVAGDVELVLHRGATLHGVLLDAGGLPHPDGVVSVHSRTLAERPRFGASRQVRTDLDGGFRFDGLPPGDYEVRAAPGVHVSVALTVDEPAALELQLRRAPRVRGRVLDVDGSPADAIVTVQTGSAGLGQRSTTGVDEHGDFAVEGLGVGTHAVFATLGDAETPCVEVDLVWGRDEVVDLRFADGRLAGTVTDATSGAPLAGAGIEARGSGRRPSGDPVLGTTRTGPDGRYALGRLPPGRLQIIVDHEESVRQLASVDLHEGRLAQLDVALRRGGAIQGHVRTLDDRRVDGLVMILEPLPGRREAIQGPLPSEGDYRIPGLPAGRYRFAVHRRRLLAMDEHVWARGELAVRLGESTTLDLVLSPPDE